MTQARYVIIGAMGGRRPIQAITDDTFRRIHKARDYLLACLALEEAFAVLFGNYLAFERGIANANIGNMVERRGDALQLGARRREIDRHLVNVLAAGEMFTEHVWTQLRRLFGRRAVEVTTLTTAFEVQRARLLGFRATEHLRDAVLHRSLPIRSWSMGGEWVDLERTGGRLDKRHPKARLEYSVSFSFDPDLLAGDRSVAPDLVQELKVRAEKDGRVSWAPVIREYVEGLSYLLADVRTAVAPGERDAVELLDGLAAGYRALVAAEGGAEQPYVLAVERGQDGGWAQELLIDFDFSKLAEDLRKGQQPFVNLHRRSLKG